MNHLLEIALCLIAFGLVLMLDPRRSVIRSFYAKPKEDETEQAIPLVRMQEHALREGVNGFSIAPREDDIEGTLVDKNIEILDLAFAHNREEAEIRNRFYDEALEEELHQMTLRHEAELAQMLETNV